jgi:hypothetical protein
LISACSEERTERALKELSPLDVKSNFLDASHAHPGTGNWFILGEVFGNWLSQKGGLVWLHGIRKRHILKGV